MFYHLSELHARWTHSFPHTAVDFGSGVTFFPFVLARQGFRVMCVDNDPICEKDLNRAVREFSQYSASNVTCCITDGESLPFETGTIDVIYSLSVLEHLPEPASIIPEFARVLTDRGALIITMDVDLSGGDLGIGPARYFRLMARLSEHFEYAVPHGEIHTLALTNRTSPYPMPCEPHVAKAVWWVVKQQLLKPLIGRSAVRWPHLGCEGLVLTKLVSPSKRNAEFVQQSA